MAFKSAIPFHATSAGGEARTAQALSRQYSAVRDQTEKLAAALTVEDQMVQSCPEASPSKWHQAHTTWFFETFVLSEHLERYRPFDSRFRDLFNSYYNAVGPQPLKVLRSTFSRPGLDEVQKYRQHVDKHMQELLASGAAGEEVLKLVELGLHHEQQHQELLVTDIKHAFWSSPLRPAYMSDPTPSQAVAAPEQEACPFSGGLTEVGAEGPAFRFDNEAPRHKVYVGPFRLALRPATCGEYLAFMADRGYERPEL